MAESKTKSGTAAGGPATGAANAAPAMPRLTRKGEQTRERIVTAAANLVFEHGVANTSIEDVKEAAGVSSSQLYHYFADKQALVHAVIAHQSDAVVALQEPLLGKLDSLDALQISMSVKEHYGVRIEGGPDARKAMASVSALADFIQAAKAPA